MNAIQKKKILISVLTAVIVFSWGFAGYNYLYPTPHYLGESDTAAVEWMLSNMCPELVDGIKLVEGNLELTLATELVEECNTRLYSQSFEDVLIEEFSKQNHR